MNNFRFVVKSLIHGAVDMIGRSRRQRNQLRASLTILTYHSFCKNRPVGPFQSQPMDRFRRQIEFLKQYFNVVALEDGLNIIKNGIPGDKPWLAITIDDGFIDNYTYAWPVLQRYDIPATIFVATDFIDTGRPPWPIQILEILHRTEASSMEYPFFADLRGHNAKSKALQRLKKEWAPLHPADRFAGLSDLRKQLRVDSSTRYLPLSWSQIREMQRGKISIGSHSVYHSIVSETSSSITRQETVDSKQRIEDQLQIPCNFFAFPDGGHNSRAEDAVKDAGYLAGLTQLHGVNTIGVDSFLLRRVEVPSHDPLATFRVRVSSASNRSV